MFGQDDEQLTSIVESFTSDILPNGVSYTYTINNGLNTRMDYSGGAYELNIFEVGNMTMTEVYNNDEATGTLYNFTYDLSGRIINDLRSYPNSNQHINRVYEYIENQILVTTTYMDNTGAISSEYSFVFTLNSNNQIVSWQNLDYDYSWEASYVNGNLMTFTTFEGSEVTGTATFSYMTEVVSEPYQIERYRYGSEWRNNIMLSQIGNNAFKKLAELGTNYLAGYMYTPSSDPSMNISLTVDYEFDDKGRLIEQVKNEVSFSEPTETVFTYYYE